LSRRCLTAPNRSKPSASVIGPPPRLGRGLPRRGRFDASHEFALVRRVESAGDEPVRAHQHEVAAQLVELVRQQSVGIRDPA
jgi:hypothetical protein